MPPQLDQLQLHSLTLRVASAWLKIAFSMDEYARLSMLEGFAGEKPGNWVNKGRRGFGIAQDSFPGMHPNWTSTRDTGVYRNALNAVEKVLRSSGVTGTGAEEVLQELNANAGTSTGPSYRRIFYTVGDSNRKHGKDKDLDAGKLTPNDSEIGGTLNRWVSQKALNVVRTQHEKMETAYPTTGAGEGYDPFRGMGTEALTEEDRMRLLLMAMKSKTSIGNRVRDFIDREIGQNWSKADAKIVRAFMEKISDPRWNTPPTKWRQHKGDTRPQAEAWFSAAVKKIGKEVMEDLDVSRQRISNVIGGGARNLLKFMEKIGKKANVQTLVDQFANEIEYLEAGPGLSLRGSQDDSMVEPLPIKQIPVDPHSIMQMWMEKKKQETDVSTPQSVMQTQFERNKDKNFNEQHSNAVQDGNPVGSTYEEDNEDNEVMADKEVTVGPLTFTIGPVPGAQSGAMRFAAKCVAKAWLEIQR